MVVGDDGAVVVAMDLLMEILFEKSWHVDAYVSGGKRFWRERSAGFKGKAQTNMEAGQ